MKLLKKFIYPFLFLGLSLPSLTVCAKTAVKGSGLPIPRFVATKATRTNLRAGPGNQYPIRWVYLRKSIPLKVVAEYDYWRKVKDIDNTEGWIHKTLLVSTQAVWVSCPVADVLAEPNSGSGVVLKAERGVDAEFLNEIKNNYAKVRISGQKGWVRIEHLWGVIE